MLVYRDLCAPTQVQVELTEACNRACLYCSNDWRDHAKINAKLGSGKLRKLVERLSEADVFDCVISGGEPLMQRDEMMELIELLQEKGISVTVNTNASLIDDALAQKFKADGIPVFTSLMSYDEDTFDKIAARKGEFKRSVAGIRRLLAAGNAVQANMVVCKQNIKQVYDTAVFAAKLGLGLFSATRVCPSSISSWNDSFALNREDIRFIFTQLCQAEQDTPLHTISSTAYPLCAFGGKDDEFSSKHQLRCTAGRLMCVVSPQGDVKPCGFTTESFGNVYEEPLKNIWAKMQPLRNGVSTPEICKTCTHLFECGSGCRASGLRMGFPDGQDPLVDVDFAKSEAFQTTFKEHNDDVDYSLDQKFCLTKEPIKRRAESFGAALFGASRRPILLSFDGLALLDAFPDKPSSINDIAANTAYPLADIQAFFQQLEIAHFLIPTA